jgi:hypothetical protein
VRLWGGGRTRADPADGQVATEDPPESTGSNSDGAADDGVQDDIADGVQDDIAEGGSLANGSVDDSSVDDGSDEDVPVDEDLAEDRLGDGCFVRDGGPGADPVQNDGTEDNLVGEELAEEDAGDNNGTAETAPETAEDETEDETEGAAGDGGDADAEEAPDDDDSGDSEPANVEASDEPAEEAVAIDHDESASDGDEDQDEDDDEGRDEPEATTEDDDSTADAADGNIVELQDDNDRTDLENDGGLPPGSDRDARDGSPAVSDGLCRGVDPGQAEGPAKPAEGPAQPAEAGAGWELTALARPALAVLTAFALVGLLVGVVRDSGEVVRRDLVYSLDGSVPDGFLREDRRLLTQIVTLESDAVLGPVADQQGMTVEELRSRIDVETVDMSEVLRLDVAASDQATARAISDAVVDQYVVISTTGRSTTNNDALLDRRATIASELATAEDQLKVLRSNEVDDARLLTTEESLERQIDLIRLQIDRLQGLLDDTLVQPTPAARQGALQTELVAAETELTDLEERLAEVRVERAELAEEARAEPSLTRDIARLEGELATIDDELTARELRPLMASPLRELGEPTLVEGSRAASALRGLALGALVGLPVAALVAASRRRQLWRP